MVAHAPGPNGEWNLSHQRSRSGIVREATPARARPDAVTDDGPDEALSEAERDEIRWAALSVWRGTWPDVSPTGADGSDDLFQVASVGLVKAALRFDPRRDVNSVPLRPRRLLGELRQPPAGPGMGGESTATFARLYLELAPAVET